MSIEISEEFKPFKRPTLKVKESFVRRKMYNIVFPALIILLGIVLLWLIINCCIG